jgi:hypothetical protein
MSVKRPSVAFRLYRISEFKAQIDSQNEVRNIETGTKPSSDGNLTGELIQFEESSFPIIVFTNGPNISGIEKQSSFQNANQFEAIFNISFEFNITGLIGKERFFCIKIRTRAQTPNLPGPNTVGPSNKILLFKRNCL